MNIGIRKEEENGKNKVYANVILLDNKIIEWGIGQDKWEKESLGSITLYNFDFSRFNELTVETSTYLVNDKVSKDEAFSKAKEWVKQWDYHDTFELVKAK